jgi:hypothetical protein
MMWRPNWHVLEIVIRDREKSPPRTDRGGSRARVRHTPRIQPDHRLPLAIHRATRRADRRVCGIRVQGAGRRAKRRWRGGDIRLQGSFPGDSENFVGLRALVGKKSSSHTDANVYGDCAPAMTNSGNSKPPRRSRPRFAWMWQSREPR